MSKLPNGWMQIDFDDAVAVVSDRGFRIKQKNYLPSGRLPVVDQGEGLIGGYTDELEAQVITQFPAIIFGDHTRRFKFVNFPFAVGADGVKIFSPSLIWDPNFLFFQLGIIDLENRGYGRHYQHLRKESLVLAPRAEQTRIVAKLEELLSDLDAGVAELKAAQKKLKQYRQSLLKAAVEGALTAEWRGNNTPTETGAQLLERILTERRARWEAKQLAKFEMKHGSAGFDCIQPAVAATHALPERSRRVSALPKDWQKKYPEPVQPDTTDLPQLPEGWVWASVEQLSEFVRNGLSKTPNTEQRGFPIFKINAVRPMTVNFDAIKHIEIDEREAADYWVEIGDVLATRYNGSVDLLGVFGMVKNVPERTLHPDKLIRMKPVTGAELGAWMEVCGNVGLSRKHLVARVKTTAGQTGISGEDLKKTPIPLSPEVEQRIALAVLEERLQVVKELELPIELALQQSAAQRQNILRAAFSGQLVPQDPNDEPASVLLERIRGERAAMGVEKKRRGSRKAKNQNDGSAQ